MMYLVCDVLLTCFFLKRKSSFVPLLMTRRHLTQYGGLDYGPSSLQRIYQEKFFKVIRDIYHYVKLCVSINGNKSDYYMSYTGVRQGENLSPLLFSLYIKDLENFLVHKNVNSVTVTDDIPGTYLKIFLNLYADDTIIIAYDAESSQTSLTHLSEFRQKWELSINIDKTKIMVFSKTQWFYISKWRKEFRNCTRIWIFRCNI